MTTAKINLNGRGIVVNVSKPRSKIANVYTPNLNVGKLTIKNPVGKVLQDDIEVNIAGILKGTGIADPTQFKYNKELIRGSDVLSSLVDKSRLDNFGSFDYITNFFFEKFYPDLSTTSEEYNFSTNKVLLDYSSISEERKLLVEKIVNDDFLVPDELKSFVGKILIDSSLSDDELALSVEKIRQDTFGKADIVTLLWAILREFSDQALTNGETKFNADKVLLDGSTSLDTPYKATTKVAMDTGSIDDLIKHVTWFRRNYFDYTYVTDDVLGEANVDDDQTAYVIKGLIESQEFEDLSYFDVHTRYRSYIDSVIDTIELALGRSILENTTSIDEAYFGTSKVVKDPYYIFEDFNLLLNKLVLDSNNVLDTYYLLIDKVSVESINSSEEYIFSIDKIFNSLTSNNEEIQLLLSKYTSDATSYSDTNNKLIVKTVIEPKIITEHIVKVLNTILYSELYSSTDVIEKHFSRPVDSDSFSIQTDLALLHPNKGINEVNVTSESGYMNKQDYFAQDYVTPGYSGTDYTF